MRPMTASEFETLGKRLFGRSAWQGQLADELKIDRVTVWRYYRGKRPIPEPVALAMQTLLARLKEAC